MPSPVRSAIATSRGLRPTAKVCCTLNVPSPLPSSTLTVLPIGIGRDQVGPAVAVQVGDRHRGRRRPDRHGFAGAKLPSPLPRWTVTVF